jgi:cell division protein FtsB
MAITNRKPRPSQKSSAHEKNRFKKQAVIIVLLALLWLFFAPGLGIVSYMSKKAELKRLHQQSSELQKVNIELQEEIDKILTDPVYLEKIAREKFKLLKPNEKVFDFSRKTTSAKDDQHDEHDQDDEDDLDDQDDADKKND